MKTSVDPLHGCPAVQAVQPYYKDAYCTIYHGDCRKILPCLSTPVDLLLADPPYGQDYKSNRGGTHECIQGDDGSLDVAAALTQACRLLRRGRHAYVFGPRDLLPPVLTAAIEIIWDKQVVGMGDLTSSWGRSHEPITFAVYEISQANRAKGYGRLSARIRQGSVLSVPRTNGAGTLRHPTEKPVKLLRQLIESSSVMDETVLDPFMGVGSALVAATLEERRSIGIELEEEHCKVAVERLVRLTHYRAALTKGAAL